MSRLDSLLLVVSQSQEIWFPAYCGPCKKWKLKCRRSGLIRFVCEECAQDLSEDRDVY